MSAQMEGKITSKTNSKKIIAAFGQNISAYCDMELQRIDAGNVKDYNRILAAMALGAVSAATGIMMEITEENFMKEVRDQCAHVVNQVTEVKTKRDKWKTNT